MHEYTKRVKQKGWTLIEVAERWGISTRRMAQIAAKPTRRDWDALNGLPNKKFEGALI